MDPPVDDDMWGEWIEDNIVSSAETEPIDMMYFSDYSKKAGFKIAIDGLHMCPNNTTYGVLFSLVPPGDLYFGKKDPQDSEVNFATKLDWRSKARSPRYMDGFFHFRDIAGKPNQAVVIEVKSVQSAGTSVKLNTDGWAILPIFK